jgi:hypothetical protein
MLLPMLSLLPHGKQSALALALPLLRNLLLAGKQSSLQLVLSPRPMPMYLPPLLSQPDIVSLGQFTHSHRNWKHHMLYFVLMHRIWIW